MKLRYQISVLKRIWRYRKALFVGVVVVAAIGSAVLYVAFQDHNSRSLIRAKLPMPQIASRFYCSFQSQSTKPLPWYEILISSSDHSALTSPMQRVVDDPTRGKLDLQLFFVAQRNSFAGVTVRFHGDDPATDNTGRARLRRRGFTQPAPVLPFSFKLVFKDDSVSGFRESHLIKLGWIRGKPAHWWPYHAWLADRLNLITPRNRLVRVRVNGEDWGVFWEFEQWGKNTFERYGIQDAELFGESDEHPYFVERYLWRNVESWKKYYRITGDEKEDLNFADLHRLLEFIGNADHAAFNREIFDYLDFDSTVGWAVHMAVMDSYHQTGFLNARLMYNRDTSKFVPIPWDALPDPNLYPRLKSSILKMPASHPLLVRLFANERFLRSYVARLHRISSELSKDGALTAAGQAAFSELYLRDDVLCPMVESPYAGRLVIRKDFTLSGLKHFAWRGPWKMAVDGMRGHIAAIAELNKSILRSQLLFVSRNANGGGSGTPAPLMILGHRGQSVVVVRSITVPLTSTSHDGEEVSVVIRLRPKALPRTLVQHNQSSAHAPAERIVKRMATIENGHLVVKDLDLALIPAFPKLHEETSISGAMAPIYSQEYELFARFDRDLPVAYGAIRVGAVNAATDRPIQPIYKNISRQIGQ